MTTYRRQCSEDQKESQGTGGNPHADAGDGEVQVESLFLIGYVQAGRSGRLNMLTPEDKRELLALARESIGDALHNKPIGKKTLLLAGPQQHSGLFVTIRIDRQLRGCIGYIESVRPLSESVPDVAIKAALEDPRFPPLTSTELDRAILELSILSPLERVENVEEIQVGIHGVLLELGPNRGLLLPQVAIEYGWDLEGLLDAVAKKAGLPPSAWRDPQALIFVFTAEVIHESEILHGSPSKV